MTLSVVIVGSGPAGFYAADALLRLFPKVEIDMIERLATPYGLIRHGVAPDRQSTKNAVYQFERLISQEDVRFLGNVKLGRDVSVNQLRELYDAVVLATGADADRTLGIPGESLEHVYGARAITGWYNGHPDHRDLSPFLGGKAVVVIGMGDVALDIVRILAKGVQEHRGSDLCAHATAGLRNAAFTDIFVVARHGPVDAHCSLHELDRLAQLENAVCLMSPQYLAEIKRPPQNPETADRLRLLADFTRQDPRSKPRRIRFVFNMSPVQILGESRVHGVRFALTRRRKGLLEATDKTLDMPVSTVITAIGSKVPESLPGVEIDYQSGCLVNQGGFIERGLYVVGWAAEGAVGTITRHRSASHEVMERLVSDFSDETGRSAGTDKAGRTGLDKILANWHITPVMYDDWERVDKAERKAAPPGRVREKFARTKDIMKLLGYSN